MSVRLGLFLAVNLIFTGCVASPPVEAGQAAQTANKEQQGERIKARVREFLAADNEARYAMTSAHYKTIYKDKKFVRVLFSKEWFEVTRFEEVKAHDGEVYVRVLTKWGFEGYEGVQTCHFKLTFEAGEWRFEWFLC